MNWKLFRNSLVNSPSHHEQLQHVALIDRSLTLIQEGLDQLGKLGHQAHIALGSEPAREEWPRLVFSLDRPDGFLCHCEEDFKFLGEGWHNTLAEVKHEAAVKEQYKGRGGVFPKRGLPAIIEELEQLTPLERLKLRGMIAPDGTRY